MKRKNDMKLIEAMILSNKVLLTEALCVFPPDWNAELGNKFRVWFRQTYEQEAVRINLDETGPYDNATVLKAFCYNPYGMETAGSKFMKTDADLGGGDDDWQLLGLNGWQWLGIIAALATIGGLAWHKFRKIRMGVRLAKQAAQEAKNYPGGKAQMLEDAIDAAKDKSKRREFLSKFLKSKNLSKAEQEAAEKAMMNPGYITAEQKFMRQMALDEFKQGNITAEELIRINKLTGEDAKMIRAIDRARKKMNNKTAWPSKDQLKKWKTKQTIKAPKRQWRAVPSNPSMKFAEDGNWYLFKGVASEKLTDAVIKSIRNVAKTNQRLANQSVKQQFELKNTVTDRLNSKLELGTARMFKKYLPLNEYPSFVQYTEDLRAAGVTDQIDITRYITGQTLWRLAKGK
jgi:hypothetical protein